MSDRSGLASVATAAPLFFIVLLGLVLRVYHLDFSSLWIDEAFTRFYSEHTLSYLWTTGFRIETNPPLYYSIIHFWLVLFGSSENALRSPSVIASLGCIVLVYVLGKELENRAVGLISAFLVAVAPTEIWYAQEARTYALLQFAMTVAMLGIARYLSRTKPEDGLPMYVLGAICAAYCHDTALFFIVACNLAVFCVAFSDKSLFNLRAMTPWLAANAVIALGLIPLVIVMLQQARSPDIQWIPPVTLNGFLWAVRDNVAGPAANREFLHGRSISYLLLLVIAALAYRLKKLTNRSISILVLLPLFFVILIALVCLQKSIFLSRVFCWTLIPFCLLWAHVLFHSAKARVPLLILTALILLLGLDAQLFPDASLKENWREIVLADQEEISKADIVIVTSPITIGPLAYYRPSVVSQIVYWPQGKSPTPAGIGDLFFYEKFGIPSLSSDDLKNAIQSGKRVCLVYSRNITDLSSSLAQLPAPDHRFDDVHDAYEFHLLTWVERR